MHYKYDALSFKLKAPTWTDKSNLHKYYNVLIMHLSWSSLEEKVNIWMRDFLLQIWTVSQLQKLWMYSESLMIQLLVFKINLTGLNYNMDAPSLSQWGVRSSPHPTPCTIISLTHNTHPHKHIVLPAKMSFLDLTTCGGNRSPAFIKP